MALIRLPIDEKMSELLGHLSSTGAVVLKAEPGAGKTTRVPPAILDAELAQLSSNRPGQIVVLQPRRIAARAAAARMSEERGTALGADVGYQVRHESRISKQTRIIVCTEGVFLRRLQDDPLIEDIAVVIFDEFHERGLESDLALAMTRLVREQVRPDLRIVIMSATLDSGPIARFLGGCPVVESAGRTFPIDIEYLQFPASRPTDALVAEGIKRSTSSSGGNLLVFLPGVAEIRQTQSVVEAIAAEASLMIMPLYGDLPLEAQQAILRPSTQRKLVLATNIAETSVTIDGVTVVIDAGLARINRFDPHVGLNRLELSRISKASAAQRAGRAGRTAAGKCIRLWTEREQQMLPDWEEPEIFRLDLSECVLRLIAWGEKAVHKFPWFEAPAEAAIDKALDLLEQLGAITSGSITEMGMAMARLPVQPRLARLLVEGSRLGVAKQAALGAALLSARSPFKRADGRVPSQFHTKSDIVERIDGIDNYQSSGVTLSHIGELLPGPTKQILRTADQLNRLMTERTDSSATNHEDQLLQAIACAFPDRVCKRRQPNDARAVMVGGRGVKLSEESTVKEADLFVAIELFDSGKSELVIRQASAIERDWLAKSHITTSIDVSFDERRGRVVALKRSRFCDLVIDEKQTSLPADIDPGTVLAQAAATMDLNSLIDEQASAYLIRLQCLGDWLPELKLPDLGEQPWIQFLPAWCAGSSSIDELKSKPMTFAIQSTLGADQITALDREAPERMALPNGRSVKLQYERGKPPVLAARIQDLFGMKETPRIARGKVGVLVHLLAPNYRVQQITPDLASFWKNTYADVKKELKGRYPKHAWPDNPLAPQSDSRKN